MQLEVESTRVAHRLPVVVPAPESRVGCLAVGTRHAGPPLRLGRRGGCVLLKEEAGQLRRGRLRVQEQERRGIR